MNTRSTYIKQLFLSLFGIAFVTVIPHMGLVPFPFGYSIPVIIVIWLLLKATGETFPDIGFDLKKISWRALGIGSLCAVLLICFLHFVFMPLLKSVFHLPDANTDDFKFVRGSPVALCVIIPVSWIIGGVYEEIVFHGYIFTRIKKLLPAKFALPIAFLLANLIFGAYHFQQNITGVIHAFVAVSAYQLLALRNKNNLWYAVFFHAMYDTIALTMIFFGYV